MLFMHLVLLKKWIKLTKRSFLNLNPYTVNLSQLAKSAGRLHHDVWFGLLWFVCSCVASQSINLPQSSSIVTQFDSVYVKRQVPELKLTPVQICSDMEQTIVCSTEVHIKAHRLLWHHLIM